MITPSGDILVTNEFGESITGYPLTATSSTNPVITISGSSTGLDFPLGVDVDTNGNIYVSNQADSAIEEFAATANGNVKPVATITGSATGLDAPGKLAVAPPLSILTTRLPHATRHAPYHARIKVALGSTPYHYEIVKGDLPPGLRLRRTTGAITGTPQRTGRFRFRLEVRDSTNPRMTATHVLSITVQRRRTDARRHRHHRTKLARRHRHHRANKALHRAASRAAAQIGQNGQGPAALNVGRRVDGA